MGSEDRVVRLNNTSGNLRGRIDGELKFGFLGVVDSQTFKEEGTES